MLLDIENLTKTFPGVNNTSPVEVLKGLELKVEEGETTAIIGQSGSGKSTLLSLLAGLDQPTSGTLKLKERHLDSMSEEELTQFRAENIGIIFQQFHLMTHLNALENVSLPLEMNHQQDALELAGKALEQVGLGSRMDHFPHQLSGGECQRVAIARAIVIRPALLLADDTDSLCFPRYDRVFCRPYVGLVLMPPKRNTCIHNHLLINQISRVRREFHSLSPEKPRPLTGVCVSTVM